MMVEQLHVHVHGERKPCLSHEQVLTRYPVSQQVLPVAAPTSQQQVLASQRRRQVLEEGAPW